MEDEAPPSAAVPHEEVVPPEPHQEVVEPAPAEETPTRDIEGLELKPLKKGRKGKELNARKFDVKERGKFNEADDKK